MSSLEAGLVGLCLIGLFGCTTVPVPEVTDRYAPMLGAQTIGLVVTDERENRTIGTVGLGTFIMDDVEDYVATVLRNELNRHGANVVHARTASEVEMDALRVPILVEAVIRDLSFVSFDALLDPARGRLVSEIRVHETGLGISMSRTFTVTNRMRVAWPNLSKNDRIVADLVTKLADEVAGDAEFQSRTLIE